MFKLLIPLTALFLANFGVNAKEYILDTSADFDPTMWEMDCEYTQSIGDFQTGECDRATTATDADGFWTPNCQNHYCNIKFTYPFGFKPVYLNMTSFLDMGEISVHAYGGNSTMFANSERAKDWTTELMPLSIDPYYSSQDYSSYREISFSIMNMRASPTDGGVLLDKIVISDQDIPPNCSRVNCMRKGNCKSYRNVCNDEEEISCPTGKLGQTLWWNPQRTPELGGSCDFWNNLDEHIRSKYINDPTCMDECLYFTNEECTSRYTHVAPFERSQEYDCSPGLVFNLEKKVCDFCYNVENSRGAKCCDDTNELYPIGK